MTNKSPSPSSHLYDVYLSDAPADWVRTELRSRLARADIDIIDESTFDLGAPLVKERERGVQQSRYAQLVVSQAWLESQWQQFDDLLKRAYLYHLCQRWQPICNSLCSLATSPSGNPTADSNRSSAYGIDEEEFSICCRLVVPTARA